MRDVCMVKLSTQLLSSKENVRATRTQRLDFAQEQKRQEIENAKQEEANKKLSGATYENYETIYNSIEPKYRQGYSTPSELKNSQDYKNYQLEKKQIAKVNFLVTMSSKADRGLAFWGWGLSKAELKEINEYRQGIGTGKTPTERRQAYVEKYFPNITGASNYVVQGTVTEFGYNPKVQGLDVGETVKIVVKDKKTGEIKREETYTGIRDEATKQTGIQQLTTTYKKTPVKYGYRFLTPEESAQQKELLKEIQEQTKTEWKKERSQKPYYLNVEDAGNFSSTQRGTINKSPSMNFNVIAPDVEKKENKVISTAIDYYNKIPEGAFYLNPVSPTNILSFGGISTTKTSDRSIRFLDVKGNVDSYLTKTNQNLFEKDVLSLGEVKTNVDNRFQEEYQTIFEDKYMEDIIDQKIDFETASKQFEESQEAKIIAKKYEKEINKKRAEKGLSVTAFQMTGIGIAQGLLKLTPTTTKGAVTESALIYSGMKTVKALQLTALETTVTSNVITGAFTVSGLDTALDKTKAPEERAGGIVTASLGGAILGKQAIKYLNKQTVKAIKVSSPQPTLKASETIRTDLNIITDKGVIDKAVYKNQQLMKIGIEGKRTITSRVWRDAIKSASNKLGLGLKEDFLAVYKGVPYAQQGKEITFQSFRGGYGYKTPSVYQKELALLKKTYKLSNFKATQTLQYTAPKVIETELLKGEVLVKGGTSTGTITYLTKQPVIEIDKLLGIKTRGARTVKQIDTFKRYTIENAHSGRYIFEDKKTVIKLLKRGNSPATKVSLGNEYTFSKGGTSQSYKGYESLGKNSNNLEFFKEINYKIDVSQPYLRTGLKQDIKPYIKNKINKQTFYFWVGEDKQRVIALNKEIDKRTKIFSSPLSKNKRTPLWKTFKEEEIKIPELKNIIKKLDNNFKLTSSSSSVSLSSTQSSKSSLDTALRQPTTPPSISLKSQIKNITKLEAKSTSISGLGISAISFTGLKNNVSLKNNLKFNNRLKNMLKEDYQIKNANKQTTSLIQLSGQKLNQPQLFDTGLENITKINIPNVNDPIFNYNPIPTPTIPFNFDFPTKRQSQRKKSLKKMMQDYTYLPDFTSRSLGLESKTLTQKQAQKQLKKIMTGFEIRRPIKIKY